ncbi:hypothetical protein [Opitutus sp. GAS368]|jgi:hypothetical protein|uniref:hypothetical protein n=1 Tax=Opitutus sp. GAS368 TaxID=1882749 RepID=UPI00087DBE08|nr:hypothetical protein [Opitutus sp. GAS368]SDS33140.1 hypothetical protein SAMN05444173_2573 [Opitutus sp. GAS368]
MQLLRIPVWGAAFTAALILAGCKPSTQADAKAAPKPAPVAPAPEPAPEPAKAKGGPKPHPKLEDIASARIDGGYVTVLFKNGRKGLFPVVDLTDAEVEEMKQFATANPLAKGKSSVVVAKVEAKKTIEKQTMVDGTETVQLVPPAKFRDQIGGTCMFYARVHYLDIAGYPIEDGEIYKVINTVPSQQPYRDYHYYVGMMMLFLRQKPSPTVHFPDGTITPFEWARQELRKGRPILAALPENIWLSLPADFLATHPFDGSGKIGHQVVINGFTWNATTKKATFHVVNSWRVLAEFDVPVEARDARNIVMEQSLSPKGAPPEQAAKITAGAITLLKPVGKQNLYSVETNAGTRKVLAASEEGAKQIVELDTSAKDLETMFGEYIINIYDYIYENADPKIRDLAASALLSEIFKIPPTITLPHVDLEVKSALGTVYFVRTGPQKVVKLSAGSTGEALEFAKRMGGGKP